MTTCKYCGGEIAIISDGNSSWWAHRNKVNGGHKAELLTKPAKTDTARAGVHRKQMPKIYIASKTKYFERWQKVRDAYSQEVNVISTWIDEAQPGQTIDHNGLVSRCIKEASSCDALVLYCEQGDVLKGALIEVGAALSAGKLVVSVGDCENFPLLFTQSNLWRKAETIREAIITAVNLRKEGDEKCLTNQDASVKNAGVSSNAPAVKQNSSGGGEISSKELFSTIKMCLGDYSHPWPNEDERTKNHREMVLDRLERIFDRYPTNELEQLRAKVTELDQLLAQTTSTIDAAIDRNNELEAQCGVMREVLEDEKESIIRSGRHHVEERRMGMIENALKPSAGREMVQKLEEAREALKYSKAYILWLTGPYPQPDGNGIEPIETALAKIDGGGK